MANADPASRPLITICAQGARRPAWQLPESRMDRTRGLISGGERSLYELAVAARSLGYPVELRGHIDEAILGSIAGPAGALPTTGLAPRPPRADEIVVLPEAAEIELIATVAHSSARGVIFVLAPPGLFGWSFLPGWSIPDPLTVTPGQVGLAASYRAMADLGFSVFAHSLGDTAAGRAAGVPVAHIGSGLPQQMQLPDIAREFDVAVIAENRWYPMARDAVALLGGGISVLTIGTETKVYGLHGSLARARTLIFPTRVEGASRITREARLVGTVPIVLDANPFVTAEDWGDGVVLTSSVTELATETAALVADPARLAGLRQAAMHSAALQCDWHRYVAEVASALGGVPPAPSGHQEGRTELSRLLAARAAWRQSEVDELRRLAEERLPDLLALRTADQALPSAR